MSRPFRILVADDSPAQAASLMSALEGRGHEVILAQDGIEAVEMAYHGRPDLIVSDSIMPRINGNQVCRLLKDDQEMRDIPIILLTHLDQKADKFWGERSGADLHLVKSGDADALAAAIEDFIAARELLPVPRGAAAEAAPGSRPESGELIGRVIELLDMSLYESTILNDIGGLLNSLEDYRKIVVSVMEILCKVIDFDLGVVILTGDESREDFVCVNNEVGEEFINAARAVTDGFLLEAGVRLAPQGHTVVHRAPGISKVPKESSGGQGIESRHVMKLATKNITSGVIGLFSRKKNAFSEKVAHTLDIISPQVNIVIHYARLYERNKQLSVTDGLTKVHNHRFFQERLRQEFARSQRQKLKLSLILLDIDNFKMVNDTHGHQQGDLVLAELARILKQGLRSLDIVSRYGGEEFALLMPDSGKADAVRVAERIRKIIEEHDFPGPGGPLRITVSLGVSAIPHVMICNPEEMIHAADHALYQAKKNGQNRVEEAV